MRTAILLAFCPLLAVSAANCGAPHDQPGAPPVVIPMKVSAGHPTIDVKISGKGPYKMLFDTGSGAELIVDADLAAEIGLASSGTRRIGDPNSPDALEAKVVSVGRVELGGLAIHDVEAISWTPQIKGVAELPRGVVGLGLLGPRLVTLDGTRGELRVESGDLPAADGKTILPATFDDGIPSLAIDVAGVTFRAHLDSGSTGFLGLPLEAAKKLPLVAAPVEVGRARTASGDYPVTEAQLKGSVRVGGIVLENPKVRFVNLPSANIGFDFLRSLVVTVDRKNARVRLVSSGTPLAPSERPRLGIMIVGPKDGRLPIEKVVAGSAAESAGLRAGDQIVKLNGREAAGMSGFELSQVLQARPLAVALLRDGKAVELTVPATP